MLQRGRGQGAKGQRQEIEKEGEGEGNKRERKGYLSWRGTKDCLWRERKQIWHIGKWWFIKVKGESPF